MMPFIAPPPPDNEATLMGRAQALAGYTLGELAQHAAIPIPPDLKRDKGWVGMLLEYYLGASAGSKAEQDFAHIGIELKPFLLTVMVLHSKRPLFL